MLTQEEYEDLTSKISHVLDTRYPIMEYVVLKSIYDEIGIEVNKFTKCKHENLKYMQDYVECYDCHVRFFKKDVKDRDNPKDKLKCPNCNYPLPSIKIKKEKDNA